MAQNIVIRKLTKRYSGMKVPALDSLSLEVGEGEVYGFLGANGAGKSTTIRTLLNFLQPSSGEAEICGLDIVSDSVEVKRHVGYLAGEIALPGKLTGQQFLDYLTALQPVKDSSVLPALIKRFDAQLHKPLSTLSKGNRQKIGIIQALMHQPDVLILDEPTSGLDPLMQEEFYEAIRESKDRGAAVFVSSHNFTEVQRMCDRIGFIREGKLIAEHTLAELVDKAAHTFTLTFNGKMPVKELRKLPRAEVTETAKDRLVVSIQGELTPLFAVLSKFHVTRLEQQEVNLEQEFLRLYEKRDA
jgi:ABC-2 type transport system ATP-binding protein